MTLAIAFTVMLAVVVGISLGLLGGGGSILTVPLLVYVAGLDPKPAIATSLLVVGVTSAAGAVSHARAGRVWWRTAGAFGIAAVVGAYAGGRLARFVPGTVLMIAFAMLMIIAAAAMLRGPKASGATHAVTHLPAVRIAVLGVGVGMVSGMVGAGGGFLLVPALALLAGLPMTAAIGTSLVVIAMQSFAGLAAHVADEPIDWRLAMAVAAAAVVGALVGGRLTSAVDAAALKAMFGWFVLLMASVVLAEEAAPAIGLAVAGITVCAAGVYTMCRRTAHCPLRRWASAGRARPVAA